jgi:hypothetical protein
MTTKKTKLKVEVKCGGKRVIARLFDAAAVADKFYHDTCIVHQQKANRERVGYLITLQVVEERPARVVSLLEESYVQPIH